MFSNFVTFTEVVKLSQNIFNQMKSINNDENIVDLIFDKQDIVSAEQVIDESNVSKFSSVLNYCRSDDSEKWLDLIYKTISNNKVDVSDFDSSLILYCCTYNKLEMIKYLIENNYNSNTNMVRVLEWAARNDYLDIIKCIGVFDSTYEYNVLMESVEYNRLEIVKYLIDNIYHSYICSLMLCTAARRGLLKMIKLLMKYPPTRDYLEELIYSLITNDHQQPEVVKYLRERLQDM